jgi:hypothetical protein
VATVGKDELAARSIDPHLELLAGITDYSDQIYGLLQIVGVRDPRPRQFVLAGLVLKMSRATNGLPELPRDVVVGTFQFLVPDVER